MIIVEFEPAHQAAVRALILCGLADHWGEVDPSLNSDLDDIAASYATGRTLVALADAAVVGTGTVMPRPNGDAEIVRMSVASSQRRTGLGRRIVAELIETARAWGATRVVLETTTAWTGVVAFYESCGFTVTHHEDGSFGRDTWFALSIAEPSTGRR